MANKPKYRTLPPRPGNSSAARELTAQERGYTKRWSRVASSVRDRDAGLCRMCLDEGGLAMAVESMVSATERHPVDHIVPAHVRPDLFFDETNLQVLCPRHHAEKTAEDLKIYGAAPR